MLAGRCEYAHGGIFNALSRYAYGVFGLIVVPILSYDVGMMDGQALRQVDEKDDAVPKDVYQPSRLGAPTFPQTAVTIFILFWFWHGSRGVSRGVACDGIR